MAVIKTSIHESYQHSLPLLWCLRELGANGIDGQELHKDGGRGAFEWSYSKRSGTVEFINWGIRIPTSALLLGTSESRSNDECIGKFGEGLPLSLKQLCYLGHGVEIFNRNEKWTPKLEAQKEFDGKRILTITTRSVNDRHAFIVRVKDVPESEWLKLQTLFLRTHPVFNEEETASNYYGKERVLLQPEFKGKVYNKGVFLLEREDLFWGYDLDVDDINRDRELMADYTLKLKVLRVLEGAIKEDTRFQDLLMQALFCGEAELESTADNWQNDLGDNVSFREKCVARFYEWYGPSAVPVDDADEMKEAEIVGLNGVIVSKTLRRILEREIDSLTERMTCFCNSVQQEVDLDQLPDEACHTFAKVVDLMRFALPDWSFSIKVVEFGGNDLSGRLSDDEKEIQLARHIVDKGEAAILKAVANLAPKKMDGEYYDTSMLLCRLIVNFTESY